MLYIAIETIIGIVVCALIIKKCPAFTIVNRKVNNLLSVVLTVVYPLVFVFLLRYSWAEYMLLESKRQSAMGSICIFCFCCNNGDDKYGSGAIQNVSDCAGGCYIYKNSGSSCKGL